MRISKNLKLNFITLAIGTLLCSYSAGNFTQDFTGNSGLPSGGQSCGGSYCHQGISGADTNRLNVSVIDGAGNSMSTYNPGSTYTIEVRLRTYATNKAGFQSVAAKFAGNTGIGTTANSIMPAATQLWTNTSSNATYVSHTATGNTTAISNGYATWQYLWTAPATNSGAIMFCTAGNVTNGNTQSTGDTCFNSVTILQAPTSISQTNFNKNITVFPNPATNVLHVNCTNNFIPTNYTIIDISSKSIQDGSYTSTINISTLPKGLYGIMLRNNTSYGMQYFSVQ